jgi:hypothetical protein
MESTQKTSGTPSTVGSLFATKLLNSDEVKEEEYFRGKPQSFIIKHLLNDFKESAKRKLEKVAAASLVMQVQKNLNFCRKKPHVSTKQFGSMRIRSSKL